MMMIKMIILSSPVDVVPVPLLPGLLVKLKKKLKEKKQLDILTSFKMKSERYNLVAFGKFWPILMYGVTSHCQACKDRPMWCFVTRNTK